MSPATQRVILVGGVGSGTSPTVLNLTVTGWARFADGTAPIPSISFTSDTTKGFYSNATNQIGVAISGTNSFAFAANGQLIGAQAGNYLQLNSTGAAALVAAGTNQSITLTPSGTGVTAFVGAAQTSYIGSLSATTYGAVWLGTGSTLSTNYAIASNGASLAVNAPTTFLQFMLANLEKARFAATTGNLLLGGLTTDNTVDALQVQGTVDISGASVTYGGTAAATANSGTQFMKTVTAIADNSATAILTVTIPNAAHSAVLRVDLSASLGAGGAIGANEATGGISYNIAISRTAGVNAVAVASSAFGSSTASVAGAATITVSAVVSAISGAVGASNTFTVNITIARGSGTSTNHTVRIRSLIINANATGITVA